MSKIAVFKTSQGTIKCKLFTAEAPETVANFIGLAEGTKKWDAPGKKGDKLYDGTIFHRVIPQFMIQGGDPQGTGMGGPGYKFADETKGSTQTFTKPGKLAMANAGPEHEWLAVFHHRDRHELVDGQAHNLRRSGRRLRCGREDFSGAARRHGPSEDAGCAGDGDD